MTKPIDLVLDRLRDDGRQIRPIADGSMAQCPAHPDRNPSLHVSEGQDGRALLTCHAGCERGSILDALGLKEPDLFNKSEFTRSTMEAPRLTALRPTLKPVCDYVYRDGTGQPVVKVSRLNRVDVTGNVIGKEFRQYRMGAAGTWLPGLNGGTPPLYRLPEVKAAAAAGALVLIVEGEKDADRAYDVGVVATTCAMGAGKWRPEHTATLVGAKVIIIADDDAPGRSHAAAVYGALSEAGARPVVALPAEGCKDLTEHLDAGHALTAIRPMMPELLTAGPQAEPTEGPTLRERMRARLYDRDSLDEIPQPTPLIAAVLDIGTIAVLSGKFGTYKTFVSIAWACSVATGIEWLGHDIETPGRVLYVAGEGGNGLKQRIRAWEMAHLDGKRISAERLMVYDGRINLTNSEEVATLAEFVDEIEPVLTIVDTLHKCAPGLDENSTQDMSRVIDVAAQLREQFGTTILFNHHTGHSGVRSRGTSSIEDDSDTTWVIRLDGDAEDRGPENPRVLTHRKSKNSVLCEEIPLTLRIVDEVGSAYIDESDSAVLPDGNLVPALAARLDIEGIGRGLSVNKTRAAGIALGFKHRKEVWVAVAKLRSMPLPEADHDQ